MTELCCEYLSVRCILTVCFYHVTYAFQSESTLYSCLNVKAKWLSVHLQTKWLWVRVQLQSLKLARTPCANASTFRQL